MKGLALLAVGMLVPIGAMACGSQPASVRSTATAQVTVTPTPTPTATSTPAPATPTAAQTPAPTPRPTSRATTTQVPFFMQLFGNVGQGIVQIKTQPGAVCDGSGTWVPSGALAVKLKSRTAPAPAGQITWTSGDMTPENWPTPPPTPTPKTSPPSTSTTMARFLIRCAYGGRTETQQSLPFPAG